MLDSLFPNHPGMVHFPIALFTAALIFEALGLWLKRPGLHDTGRAALFLGTVLGLLTVGTGLWGEELVEPRPAGLDHLVDRHETLAFVVISLAVVLCMWRISIRKRYQGGRRTLFVALLAVLAGLVLFTGHLGGLMVYEHGAAVTVGKRTFGAPPLPAESLPGRSAGHQPGTAAAP